MPTQAAKAWLKADAAYKAAEKERKAAATVLLEHFRDSDDREFRGVSYSVTYGIRLDTALARAALGPKKTAECEVPTTRETLSAVPK